MSRLRTLAVVLGMTAPHGLAAQAIHNAQLSSGKLAFDGRGTLGPFTGTTVFVKGQLAGAESITAIRAWVEAPTRSLVTGNGKRDHDMYQSLEVEKYPTMRFDLDRVDAAGATGDSVAVTLHGRFTIHGRTRAADVPGWAWLAERSIRFRGSLPMDARDYAIGGLSKMLGILKMDPRLMVRIEVVFRW